MIRRLEGRKEGLPVADRCAILLQLLIGLMLAWLRLLVLLCHPLFLIRHLLLCRVNYRRLLRIDNIWVVAESGSRVVRHMLRLLLGNWKRFRHLWLVPPHVKLRRRRRSHVSNVAAAGVHTTNKHVIETRSYRKGRRFLLLLLQEKRRRGSNQARLLSEIVRAVKLGGGGSNGCTVAVARVQVCQSWRVTASCCRLLGSCLLAFLVWTTLNTFLALLSGRVDTGSSETKLDTALARAAVIAFLASLLAVD